MNKETNKTGQEIKTYKGMDYFQDKDDLWKVILDKDSVFIVALDDSKTCGHRRILEEANTENTCRNYIDFCTSER